MNDQAIETIINELNRGIELQGSDSDHRRGKGIGIEVGIEKTLKALGYEVLYDSFSGMAFDIVEIGRYSGSED